MRGTPQPRCSCFMSQTRLALSCLPFCSPCCFLCLFPSSPLGDFLPNFEGQLWFNLFWEVFPGGPGKSLWLPFLSFFSYMTTHVFVTVCQLAYLCWEFPVFDAWLCPQQDQHSCLEQPCRMLVGWMNEWVNGEWLYPGITTSWLAPELLFSRVSPLYRKRGKQKEGTALEERKKINKNVNLVEKSCPRLAVGRDKTGMAEPWLTVEER